ncbi:acyltransferase family protein [Undibacterium sp. Di26W]|uniref:acyltransferase family protein n=1 Tax=Undibacterium sp. Di26W TaxID=3413035 RepID=UPI003BF4516E
MHTATHSVTRSVTDSHTLNAPLASRREDRLHGLDALRAFALLLGVLLHASMSFLPGARFFWVVNDHEKSILLGPVFFMIHVFRMPLFFMLAGFFAHMGLQKKGVSGFIRDRARRIALPLLIGWPLIFGIIVAAVVLAARIRLGGNLPKQSPPIPSFTPGDFPLAHLWFLYMLLLLYIPSVALWTLWTSSQASGLANRLNMQLSKQLDKVGELITASLTGWAAPFLLAVPVALALFYIPYWTNWFGVPTPDQSLYPSLAAWVSFGMAFSFGWLLQSCQDVFDRWKKRWAWHLLMAFALSSYCLLLVGMVPRLMPAPHDADKLLYAFLYAAAAWHFCFGLTGLGLRYMNQASPALRYVADASYWIYLIHLPLIMAAQACVSRSDWHWLLKLMVVLCSTLLLTLLSYHWLVRYTWLGAVLNGKRAQRLTRAPQHG